MNRVQMFMTTAHYKTSLFRLSKETKTKVMALVKPQSNTIKV